MTSPFVGEFWFLKARTLDCCYLLHDNKKIIASLSPLNLENVQTNLNPLQIRFASSETNSTIENFQAIDVTRELDFEVVDVVDSHLIEVNLEELKKQGLVWNLHRCISLTWAFSKVNNNQPININANQIMKCTIYHNQIYGPKILALHMKCYTKV